MRSVILILAFVATTAFTAATPKWECYGYNQSVGAVFEIESLSNTPGYAVNVTGGTTLRYNYCRNVTNVNTTFCKVGSSSAVLQNNSDQSCIRLTNGTTPKFYAQDPKNPLGGVFLVYPGGDIIPGTGNVSYNYTVALQCNQTGSYNFKSLNITGNYSQNYLIQAAANQGCPVFAFYQLADFVNKYKAIFIITGTILGVFVAVFGLRLFKPTLFLVGFAVISLLMAFVLFTFALGNNPTAGAQWGCLAGALVVGALAGLLLVKLEKVGIFFLGAWLGTSGSFLLYSLILSHMRAGNAVLIAFTVVAAVVCGIVALFIFEHVIILSTSLGGAYLAVRAVSLFAPPEYAYPNEIDIAREIEYNGLANIPGIFYLYFFLIMALAAGGAVLQYKAKRARDAAEGHSAGDYPSHHHHPYHAHP